MTEQELLHLRDGSSSMNRDNGYLGVLGDKPLKNY